MVLVEICRSVAESQLKGISSEFVALIVSRLTDRLASLVGWDVGGEKLGHVFNRQALPVVWDFAEGTPFSGATGSYKNVANQIQGAVQSISGIIVATGQVQSADASDHPLPDQTAGVWFTDPPYYDAVPYADLSDFFLVWLKRTLPDNPLLHDRFDSDNSLSPKDAEAVQDEIKQVDCRPKDREWFEETMAEAFAEGRRVLDADGVGSVVFAHKTTEGWEALLSGVIQGGWTITGSWPIATERPNRFAVARLRRPRHQHPPRLPPASQGRAHRRLGRRAARVSQSCGRLDGAIAGRRHSWRGPGLCLHRPGSRNL